MRNVKNYSDKMDWELYNMIPSNLNAEKIVILPDVNQGKAPLPTGCAVETRQEDWRKFAISDVGCGMILLKSKLKVGYSTNDFRCSWNQIVKDLQKNKGGLGDLGSGNHFLDALESKKDGTVYFLIHTGSRDESKKVESLLDIPEQFDKVFFDTCEWASENRLAVAKAVEKHYGSLETVVHNNHNHFEILSNSVIIRKGAVRLYPGQHAILPSHMTGEAVLVRGKDKLSESLYSISHGTGRVMSRSDAKEISRTYDLSNIRKQIYIPESIRDESIKTDAPFCYRSIDDVMILLDDLVTEVERFKPIAYIGHI